MYIFRIIPASTKSHRHCSAAQMLASSVVDNGTGVYWLFYTGGDFAETVAPTGLPGFTEGAAVEGLRCAADLPAQ
jgi:hypothetical protein